MKPYQIVLIVLAVLIVLGVAIIPAINRRQLKKMPIDQQIRILMQQANKLIYWKNISEGTALSIRNLQEFLPELHLIRSSCHHPQRKDM